MSASARATVITLLLALAVTGAMAQPLTGLHLLPQAKAAGSARLTFFGFQVYDASLWVTPGFRQSDFASHGFALELAYLRDFKGAEIARRSIDEMRRAGDFSAGQAARWTQAMDDAFPDVRRGDRLMGVNKPGGGVLFFHNGNPSGEIADARFARLFFAIWLGPNTSEPGMRAALLEGTPP